MGSHIEFKELLEIISWGLLAKQVKGTQLRGLGKYEKVENAFYGGVYIGSPGKDIYKMLSYLSEDQMKKTVVELCKVFPKNPPGNHVNVAACIRFIYGQFEKNGTLKSENEFKKMKENKPEWLLSRKFLRLLHEEFIKNNNFYGLSILCEMEGHRLGDESLINKDINKLKEMEEMYIKSVVFADKCKSYKQLFTPYYWAAMYFIKYGDNKNAIKYSRLTIIQAEKYCPDARRSYVEKILNCFECISKDKNEWKNFYKKYKNSIKNKCVKKAFKEIKK